MKMLKWPFGGGEGNIVCVYVCVRVYVHEVLVECLQYACVAHL